MKADSNASFQPAKAGPIAYLTGEYPKVSHTFIQREIAALRGLGLTVHSCTVRRPDPHQVVGEDQRAEAEQTFCILDAAKRPDRLLSAHLSILRRNPRRWLSTLRLAWRTRPPGAKALIWQFFYFLESAVLARHLRRAGVAHLHNHFANSSCSVAMLTSEISGIPFSFTLHGPAIFYEAMYWRLDEKVLRANFVNCISHFSRSQAMYFSDPSHWGKLRIVHCGVTPAAYGTRVRDGYGRHILFVGRLDPVKGVPLLLDAFAEVRRTFPDARLSIVGDGPARAALEAQAATLDLGTAVTFLGYREQQEVATLLEEADMLALPSFAEGLPVVLMEALASRIPVIASAVAGVPELVEDGVTGFVVPAGDVEALTERLGQLLADPELCRQMGEAGRAKVEADFDIDKEAGRIIQLYQENRSGRSLS